MIEHEISNQKISLNNDLLADKQDQPNIPEGEDYYRDIAEADKKESYMKKVRGIALKSLICLSTLSAFGIFVSSCTPTSIEKEKGVLTSPLPTETSNVTEESATPTPILVEKTPTLNTEPTPTETVKPTFTEVVDIEEIPYISTEKNESFNMESINFLEWENFTLDKDIILEESETVTTVGERNRLLLLPMSVGDSKSMIDVTTLDLPSGYTFNIKQKKVISNSVGESITFGVIENTFENYGDNTSFALLLDGKDSKGNTQGFVENNFVRTPSVTFINSEPGLFMNDVDLQVLSLLRISQSQINYGGFEGGQRISLKDLLSPIDSFRYYRSKGEDKFDRYVGTDSIASSLNLLSRKESNLLSVENSKDFFGGPRPGFFTVNEFNWEAALGEKENEDFIFFFNEKEQENRFMIKVEPIFANVGYGDGRALDDSSSKIIFGATISLISYSPEEELEVKKHMQQQITELQTLYDNYNYYNRINKGRDNHDEGKQLVPMVIPRESKYKRYYHKEFNIQDLIGDNKPFPFLSDEEIQTWMNKSINNLND